jgi:hypothetical protein
LYEDGPTDEHMLIIKWTCFYDFLQLGQDNEHQQKKSTVQLGISIVFMGYRTFPASLVKYVLKHDIYIYMYIYMRRRQNQLFTPGAKMLAIVFLWGTLSLYSVLCKSTLNNTNMQRNCYSSTMSKTASSKISKIRGSLLFCKDILVACLVFWKNANKNK